MGSSGVDFCAHRHPGLSCPDIFGVFIDHDALADSLSNLPPLSRMRASTNRDHKTDGARSHSLVIRPASFDDQVAASRALPKRLLVGRAAMVLEKTLHTLNQERHPSRSSSI